MSGLLRHRRRSLLTASALLAFAALYPLVYAVAGAGVTALCAIPILVAGYLWGMRAGAVTGLLIVPLVVLLLLTFNVPEADLVLKVGRGGPVILLAMTAVGVVVGRLRDLALRVGHETEARLISDRRYADLFENAHDMVFTYNLECELTNVNPAAEQLLGYSREELVGMDPGLLIPGDQWEAVRQMLNDCLEGRSANQAYVVSWTARDGHPVILEISPLLVVEDGEPVGIQGIARDISERKRIEETLRHQALHDGLTGLPNRILLEDRLSQAIKRAGRLEETLAVMVMDLEEFKAVNDTFGHQVGDDLLRQVGGRLSAAMRESDTVARMGGDEFGIVLGGIRDEADAALGAGRLLAALEESIVVEGQRIAVGASIGVALFPFHGEEPGTLVRRADVALYAAKRAGRGFSFYAVEDDQFNPRRLALRAELRDAIEKGALELHFQPKVACATGVVVGVEALVRWRHPDHGLMAPDQFIPIAEQSGLMAPLTAWVIAEALRWSARWTRLGFELTVAVNLSARQLQDRQLPGAIADAIGDRGMGAHRLQLELTESAIMADAARALEILDRISALGIKLSIDDFGTGYSSLSYLRKLPVDEIKIDRSFVIDLVRNDADAVIVRSIIDLGHNLGLSVVAEGVEDRETMKILAELGCDLAQGFYVSRPLPPQEFQRWFGGRHSEAFVKA